MITLRSSAGDPIVGLQSNLLSIIVQPGPDTEHHGDLSWTFTPQTEASGANGQARVDVVADTSILGDIFIDVLGSTQR